MNVGMARASAPIAALDQRDLSSRRRKIVDACSVDRHSVGPDARHSLDRQSISLARDVSLYLPSAMVILLMHSSLQRVPSLRRYRLNRSPFHPTRRPQVSSGVDIFHQRIKMFLKCFASCVPAIALDTHRGRGC
jgi:hypothetical protein